MFNFLLFDAARAEATLPQAQKLNPLHRSLYKGSIDEELSGVAPYLFTCQYESEFANWFRTNGYGSAWGIFVQANVSFEDCFKQFQKFLRTKGAGSEQLYFRFYDPRVLRIFLPTCDKEQLKEFFGPIKMFIMEDEDPAFALQFWLQNYELKSKRVPAKEIFGDLVEAKGKVTEIQVQEKSKPLVEATDKQEQTKVVEPATTEEKKRKRTFF